MKRASRLWRWVSIIAILLILFTLIGFFVIPPIARSQMEKRLSAQLGRRVTVEKVRLNPYTLGVAVENFSIFEADNTTPFLGWRRLYLNADPLSSWKEWSVKEIALDGFASRVGINPDQSFNFSDILARLTPPESSATTPPAETDEPSESGKPARGLRIGSLRVADARVDFSDQSRSQPFATTLGPLTFALTEFRTVSDTGAPYHFEAVSESGEKLAWRGTLQAEPPASSGELTIENILLAKYAPYYADRIQADLVDGSLSLRGHYDVRLDGDERVAKLSEGSVQLRGIKLLERASREPAVELPALDVTGIQADATSQKATIGSVALTGGQVRARREKDGTINLLAMLQPPGTSPSSGATPAPSGPPPTAPAPAATAEGPKPEVTVGEFTLKDFRIEVADQAAPRPTQLALDGIEMSMRELTLTEGAQMPLQLAFNWAPQGTVRIDGNVAITPLKADLTVDVASLALLPAAAYLEEFANARLTEGALTAGLIVEFSSPEGQPPLATVTGGAKLEKIGLVDSAQNEELAGFGAVTLSGLHATTAPELTIKLDEVTVTGPYARVIMDKDKSLNLASIVPAEGAPASSPPAPQDAPAASENPSAPETAGVKASVPSDSPAEATPPPRIDIGKVVISEGDFRFTDRSVDPNVSMTVDQFGGTIAGLSSTNPAKADLDLKATVDGAGPIAITGKIDPFAAQPMYDLKVDFKNVDLVPLSPYSGKFAGFELARGKLVLDVKVNVEGSKIDASNVITLNQFTFGDAVKSPDATSLPVRLGVALLKDREGKIVIDVPIQGSTEDPSFKVGRVVGRVITNLLTKVATSPFSLIGAAFGGGGEELRFQEFAPGSTAINPDEVKKLETMVKALTERPGLSLMLQGSYDPLPDTHALKEAKLSEMVRRAIWERKRDTDPNIPPPQNLAVTPEEEAAMIKTMYDEKFPPGTRYGAPLPPPPEMVSAPPPPEGLLPRFFASISGKAERDARAVQEENERRLAEHAKAIQEAINTGLPTVEMRDRLLEDVKVDGDDLRALASARARAVRDYFTRTGNISPDRLFLAKEKAEGAKDAEGARVALELQ